jgi:hypothetical protein
MSNSLILIYGDQEPGIKKLVKDLKGIDKNAEIALCSARRFSGVPKPCKKVFIFGNYPLIAEAYAGKVDIIGADPEVSEDPAPETDNSEDPAPAFLGRRKRK